MKIKYIFSAAVLLLILMFTACNADGPGIFYTIYNEKKITESAISSLPVYKVTSDGTDLYVLAGAAVYKQNGTSWTKLSPPSEGMRAVSLARLGTNLYAVYETETSGSLSDTLYELSGTSWSIATSTSSISGSLNLQLVDVDYSTSGFIFVSQRTGSDSFVNYAYDGSTLSTGFDSGKGLPLTGAGLYNGGSDIYYLTA